jgi:serine/threonine protein kinase
LRTPAVALDLIPERDREQPLDLARFLRFAIGFATVLGHAHQRDLINKDVKPENVLVDDAGQRRLAGQCQKFYECLRTTKTDLSADQKAIAV